MIDTTKKLIDPSLVQNFITAVILLTAVLVGLETYPSMIDAYGPLLHTLDLLILAIFVTEIALKLVARWPRPELFFIDPSRSAYRHESFV